MAKPPVFDLMTTRIGEEAVVRVVGDLDAATGPRLHDELDALAGGGMPRVTVDLAKVTFLSSSALSVLVAASARLRGMGGDLRLQAPSPLAMKVLEMTGLSGLLAITAQGSPS